MKRTYVLIIFCSLLAGCDFPWSDRNVAGMNFHSGFRVSRGQAFDEGYAAGLVACSAKRTPWVKYKSGTEAAASWISGYQVSVLEQCPDDVI